MTMKYTRETTEKRITVRVKRITDDLWIQRCGDTLTIGRPLFRRPGSHILPNRLLPDVILDISNKDLKVEEGWLKQQQDNQAWEEFLRGLGDMDVYLWRRLYTTQPPDDVVTNADRVDHLRKIARGKIVVRGIGKVYRERIRELVG